MTWHVAPAIRVATAAARASGDHAAAGRSSASAWNNVVTKVLTARVSAVVRIESSGRSADGSRLRGSDVGDLVEAGRVADRRAERAPEREDEPERGKDGDRRPVRDTLQQDACREGPEWRDEERDRRLDALHAPEQTVRRHRIRVAADDGVGRGDRERRREDAGRQHVDIRPDEEERAAGPR